MRDEQRIPPMIDTLKNCWNDMPDLRFGQLVQNIILHYKGADNLISDLWNMEEDEWLKAIQSFSDHHKRKWIAPPDEKL